MPGQRWVLDVVRNRFKSPDFPNTICDVVMQHKAFSWYLGKQKRDIGSNPIQWGDYIRKKFGNDKIEMEAWKRSLAISSMYYYKVRSDYSFGSTHFMTVSLYKKNKVCWARHAVVVATIGDHIFFTNVDERKCNVKSI